MAVVKESLKLLSSQHKMYESEPNEGFSMEENDNRIYTLRKFKRYFS